VRYRAKLVALRSELKAQVHAVLAQAGILIAVSDLFGVEGPSEPVGEDLAAVAPGRQPIDQEHRHAAQPSPTIPHRHQVGNGSLRCGVESTAARHPMYLDVKKSAQGGSWG
jgi:hypothetical protein